MKENRINTLTSLRFFMIINIVFTHFYFLGGSDSVGKFIHTHIQNPSLPVEFFFVMSGFGLTYRSLMKRKNAIDGKFSLYKGLKYGIERMKKLYWLYVLTMATMIPLTVLWNNWELNNWAMSGIQTMVHFFSDLTLTQSLYGVSSIANELNGPCWFISTLFILYCFYPLLEKLNKRIIDLSADKILLLLILTEIVSYIILIPFSYIKDITIFDYLAYGSPYTRFFSMFTGILVCDLFYKSKISARFSTTLEVFVLLLSLLWIYNMRVYYDPQESYGVRYPVVAIINNLISLSIVYVFAFQRGNVSQFLQNAKLVSLGGCAMYVYLIHYPVIYNVYGVINQCLPMTALVKLFTTIITFVIIAILTYYAWKHANKNAASKVA